MVAKPSELTPLTTLRLGTILKSAGLPDGVFNVLPGLGGVTGKALVEQSLVRKVDVTGGTEAGRAIGRIAGEGLKRYTAELGGKAPLVVFRDADLRMAVNGIVFGSFIASGQTCIASTRIIVDNVVLDEVLQLLKEKTESIASRVGAPTNPACAMGPLISARQIKRVGELVDDAVSGGFVDVVTGGRRMGGKSMLDGSDLGRGYFYAPTVLAEKKNNNNNHSGAGLRDARIWREEAFGPVIVVAGFDTEDEAVALANDSEFGLGAGLWTQDLSRAFRVAERIDAGITWVNTHHRNDPSSPWGGSKAGSGLGVENGVEAYHAYTTAKSTIINYASTEESLAADDWFRDGDAVGAVRYG